MSDLIDRQQVIEVLQECYAQIETENKRPVTETERDFYFAVLGKLSALAQEIRGYEYHYDHTDCIWYRLGECPVTCAQYRDGWNDAMTYIFKGGEGYKPYRRGGDGR